MAAEESEKQTTQSETQDKSDESKAVSLSPEEIMNIKHPLQNRWTLWFFKQDKNQSKSWTDCLLEITSFDTVEDFWALYHHIEMASHLPQGCDYSVFKSGIKPMWEDAANNQGGKWMIALNRAQRAELNNYWLELLLCLIGESFGNAGNAVCGAVCNVRGKGDKINLWTAHKKHDDVMAIGHVLRARLGLPNGHPITFHGHDDFQHKNSSNVKALYRV